jgi:multicomponent Na+:H+ antiporter subunit G
MIGLILIFIGSAISVIGAAGLVRFPDIYSRSHAQTVVNVGGTCLILFGVFLETFPSLYSVKSMLLIVFIFLTSPVGTHAIARAAYKSGVKPRVHEDELGYKIKGIEKPKEKEKSQEKKKHRKPRLSVLSLIRKTREQVVRRILRKDDW